MEDTDDSISIPPDFLDRPYETHATYSAAESGDRSVSTLLSKEDPHIAGLVSRRGKEAPEIWFSLLLPEENIFSILSKDMIGFISSNLKVADIISLYSSCKTFRGMVSQEEMIIKINNANCISVRHPTKQYLCHECNNIINIKIRERHKKKCTGKNPTCYSVHLKQIAKWREETSVGSPTYSGLWPLSTYVTACEGRGMHGCPFFIHRCSYCGFRCRNYLAEKHSECGKVIVKCHNECGFECTREQAMYNGHAYICPSRPIRCVGCEVTYLKRDIDAHQLICVRTSPAKFGPVSERVPTTPVFSTGGTRSPAHPEWAPTVTGGNYITYATPGAGVTGSYMNINLSYQ